MGKKEKREGVARIKAGGAISSPWTSEAPRVASRLYLFKEGEGDSSFERGKERGGCLTARGGEGGETIRIRFRRERERFLGSVVQGTHIL